LKLKDKAFIETGTRQLEELIVAVSERKERKVKLVQLKAHYEYIVKGPDVARKTLEALKLYV
jgi:hypothetical protein